MQDVLISLVICTYNPRRDYLERVIESLKGQALPLVNWELVIVDNASQTPVASFLDLSWHPRARIVLEKKQGLTHARLCGIRHTNGPLILFIDDDNVLPADYMAQALDLEREFPQLGVWGAAVITPEYEKAPAPELEPFCSILALKNVARDSWSNLPELSEISPFGAGMVVRRGLGEKYAARKTEAGVFFGRSGSSLLSSDDYEISLIAADEGTGYGVFRRLTLTHLIPSRRVEREYLLRLYEACAQSDLLLLLTRMKAKNPVGISLAQIARRLLPPLYKMIAGRGIARSIFYRVFVGRCKALRMDRDFTGPTHNIATATAT